MDIIQYRVTLQAEVTFTEEDLQAAIEQFIEDMGVDAAHISVELDP